MATGWENGNLFERIRIRDGEMADERRDYEDDFEEIIEIFNPGLSEFEERTDKKRIRDTFDGTPSSALRIMSDGMQGSIVSRAIPWLRYSMADQRLKEIDEVVEWLQACEEHMIAVYGRSGFYPALGPYFRAALSVGTPAIISEENIKEGGKIECTVPHPRENYFRFDSFGVPVQYHRRFEKTTTQLLIELKERNISTESLSLATQQAIRGGKNTRIKILQVYYRADDPIFQGLEVTGEFGDRLPQMPWRTYIMETGADAGKGGKKKPFEASGHRARPHAVWRYEISTDEIYARTPAWFSLHDARGEITASKTLMEAAEGYVRPQYFASNDMRGRIHRKPNSTSYASTTESFVKDMPQAGKNYPIADKERDRMVANVERWFDVAFYQLLMRSMLAGGSPPTATQIIGVEGETGRLQGTKVERVVNDALTPIDDTFWSIELHAGRLPHPEDFGAGIVLDPEFTQSGKEVNAEFIGPLLQAQQKAFIVRRFLEGKGMFDEFVKTWPELIHKVDGEDMLEKLLEEIGTEKSSIRSKEEFAEILAGIAAREREKQQLEAGAVIADAVLKLGKAVEPNSPIAAAVG